VQRILTLLILLLVVGTSVRAQSSEGRGTRGWGSRSSSAQGIASATVMAPVTIRLLHFPEDFAFGPSGEREGSSQLFSVGGAPDFAISITVPERTALTSPEARYGSLELTGIHNTTPEPVAFNSSKPNELRFGLMVTPPSDIADPSRNERGAYVGSCMVTVNYN
jgi:hypothetical protein